MTRFGLIAGASLAALVALGIGPSLAQTQGGASGGQPPQDSAKMNESGQGAQQPGDDGPDWRDRWRAWHEQMRNDGGPGMMGGWWGMGPGMMGGWGGGPGAGAGPGWGG
ncbi:hypothetical protein, partial [Propylenella binzhouense]